MARNVKTPPRGQGAEELLARAEQVRESLDKARAFTEDLLRENDRLRGQLSGIGGASGGPEGGREAGGEGPPLQRRIEQVERERNELLERVRQADEMNHSLAKRCEEIEAQHQQLANLYVASYQIHATLNFKEVVDTVKEILINLIGAESFALFWVEERQGFLRTVAAEGTNGLIREEVRFKGGPLSSAVRDGQSYYADPVPARSRLDPTRPIACIPLKIGDRVIGVVAIYRLLEQKERFSPLDFELFSLLAGHAATALFSSKLYQQSEQKLSNLQGFLNMLTAPSS